METVAVLLAVLVVLWIFWHKGYYITIHGPDSMVSSEVGSAADSKKPKSQTGSSKKSKSKTSNKKPKSKTSSKKPKSKPKNLDADLVIGDLKDEDAIAISAMPLDSEMSELITDVVYDHEPYYDIGNPTVPDWNGLSNGYAGASYGRGHHFGSSVGHLEHYKKTK